MVPVSFQLPISVVMYPSRAHNIQSRVEERSAFDFHIRHGPASLVLRALKSGHRDFNPYPTAFPYGNGMVLHIYQQQESSTNKTVHKVINKGLKTYV